MELRHPTKGHHSIWRNVKFHVRYNHSCGAEVRPLITSMRLTESNKERT